ncbi:MAG: helix-turn-helix domain-containing protein [Candidatus Thiodiazotropha sp.]
MLLTKKQAAEQLAVSPRTVQRLIDSSELRVVKITDSTRGERIHPDDLEAFIQSKRHWQSKSTKSVSKLKLVTGDVESDLDHLLMTKRERQARK